MARKKPRTICTIDAETDPFKHGRVPKPFSWGFYDGDNYVDFWGDDCTDQLMEYLSTESNLILYAHNGGKFDFHFLLPYLDEELMIINGRIAKATLFDGAVELRDSMLLLPMALAQYQKDQIDYKLFERKKREKHKKEILRYQRSDCIYLHEWVMAFIKQFGLNLTLAGTAFKELKKTSYQVQKTFIDYDDKFRPFYYGGRVQCFDVGKFVGDYKYIDINSAYSYAMTHRHWYGSGFIECFKLPDIEKNGSWFADVEARSKGALPIRGLDNKLYYPVDDVVRNYKVTGWEINAGLKTGTIEIVKVNRVYKPNLLNDFCEYVDKFFKMKNDAKASGDKTAYQFAKFMLNSCYGKFGQDGRKFEKFVICGAGEVPTKEGFTKYATTVTYETIFSKPDPQDQFFNVSTAASVTGFVRAYLWEAICNSEGVLYCDTDSLVCKDTNVELDGEKLGAWDVEAEPKEVYIAQRKMYAMRMANYSPFGPVDDTKVASKGVRLSFNEIKNGVINGDNITQYRDAPAFSIKYGARFLARETNFENLREKLLTSPP